MLIRSLVPADKNKIRRILCQGDTFRACEVQVAMELVDDVLANPAHPDYHIRSAVLPPDEFAGFICYGPIPMTEYCYDLYWIAVDKQFSNGGVGSQLIKFMEAHIVRKKGKHVYVDTSSTPAYAAARFFYEKHDYRPVCTLNDFYRKGDHKIIFRKEV